MKQSQLKPYAPLYRAVRYYGSDQILRDWLGKHDMVLPLLLPHGVEIPGQYREPADARGMEPIYWAINEELHAKAQRIKPSILIPHPLLLTPAFERSQDVAGEGVLIIGAPPGKTNDRLMREALRQHGIDGGTVLVKRRVGWEGSEAYWHGEGFNTANFGEPFSFSYNEMARALSGYDHVISTTASTAAFFAAACGARVTLLKGCPLMAYELLGVTAIMERNVPEANAWLKRFAAADRDEQHTMALDLLGNQHNDRQRIDAQLHEMIAALDRPLWVEDGPYPAVLAQLQAKLAIVLGKPRLASLRPATLWQALARPKVGVMTIKENDYYLDGPSSDAFMLDPVPYRRGITEPGFAIDPY